MPSNKSKRGKKGYGVKKSPSRKKTHSSKILKLSFYESLQKAILNMDTEEWKADLRYEDDRMEEFFPNMKTINKLGFLTYDSQSGQPDNWYNERSYMEGFMKKEQAIKFIQKINTHTDKVALYLPSVDDGNNKLLDMAPSLDLPLTIEKDTKKVITHRSMFTPTSHVNFLKSLFHMSSKEKDILTVFCFDPVWNRKTTDRDGLFTTIEKYLKD